MTKNNNKSANFYLGWAKGQLRQIVTVAEENMVEKAYELHQEANKMCFIANSCNFPIRHNPQIEVLS